MLQNPVRARCCGFGNKGGCLLLFDDVLSRMLFPLTKSLLTRILLFIDRRAVDPPPVVEVVTYDDAGRETPCTADPPLLLLHASLFDATGTAGRELVENVYSTGGPGSTDAAVHVLIGSTVATAQCLADEHGAKRCMFLFPDLSVRLPGQYRLRFTLVDVEDSRSSTYAIRPVFMLLQSSDLVHSSQEVSTKLIVLQSGDADDRVGLFVRFETHLILYGLKVKDNRRLITFIFSGSSCIGTERCSAYYFGGFSESVTNRVHGCVGCVYKL
ncbi:hypothetical protein HK097_007184 [Rhizophlyctis rosea]|uniref:Velvet domain-containing protein n=1 Tax=Rhizophlyctis rosea TaxID=64517 RepID=A0AAD5X4R4_9FUNG|nr:hypothetical protein HK097_007184 [Rhizophlyctis rosea]